MQPDELTIIAGERTDKGNTDHNFLEIYEKFLQQWRNDPIRILEIGIYNGGSLQTWYDYFKKANIFGIDINKSNIDNDRVKTFVADQSKREQLQEFINNCCREFDIIIDDGGHRMNQQQISFGFLFKFVKPGGYYIIEDLHTSLSKYYKGFGNNESTTLDMVDNFIITGEFNSSYILSEEIKYLNDNVEFANLNFRNNNSHSIMCIFKKKFTHI